MGEVLPKARIRIVGTSHISTQSAQEIRKAFEEFQPDIVAVELDSRRLQTLGAPQGSRIPLSMARQLGLTGWLFLVIASWLQRKLAGIVKVRPGVDMLAAVRLAKEHNKMLLLADQDVLVTTRKLSRAFTWREKFRMLWDVLSGPFKKEKVALKLDEVPSADTIRKLMDLMKDRYPSLYRVLVEERNVVMAAKVDRVLRTHPHRRVLMIVGAGHEEDLRARFESAGRFETE